MGGSGFTIEKLLLVNLQYKLPKVSIKFCSTHCQSFIISFLLAPTAMAVKNGIFQYTHLYSHLFFSVRKSGQNAMNFNSDFHVDLFIHMKENQSLSVVLINKSPFHGDVNTMNKIATYCS